MAEKKIGVMVHKKLGDIPILSKAWYGWRARRNVIAAEKKVEKLIGRIKNVCESASDIESALVTAEQQAEKGDSLSARRDADALRFRFRKILDACAEGSEKPKSEAAKDIKDTRRDDFIEAAKACRKQTGISTQSNKKQRVDWVACMKPNWPTVVDYLRGPELKTHSI